MKDKRRIALIAVGILTLLPGAASAQASARTLGRVTAKAAMLVDNRTGEVLLAREPDLPLPPASTTKILTALIALQSGQLDRDVVVSESASKVEPSKINLRPGWRMNVRDLVYALLMNSANDASVALAEGLAGSVPRFSQKMNTTAQSLGASNSRFMNPNGLPDDEHYSTVRDLIIIMRQGLRLPQFREILSTKTTVIFPRSGSQRPIKLHSHNRFLDRTDIQVIGKTGWTRAARRCFVGAAIDGDREILVAMLGSENLWGDLGRLLDYAFGRASDDDLSPPSDADWARASKAPPPRAGAGDAKPQATRYALVLASFSNQKEAAKLQDRLRRRGYSTAVERVVVKRRASYRVIMRSFPTRTEAERAARLIRKEYGVTAVVISARA